MTDKTHPITPPPELVEQWIEKYNNTEDPHWQTYEQDIATQAARWGADQELEACCEWLGATQWCEPGGKCLNDLRAARRPKPPSLKQQALAVVENSAICDHLSTEHAAILRRALEQLPND